jgi:hypothetical protein
MGDRGSGAAESGTAPMARSPEVVTSGIPIAGWYQGPTDCSIIRRMLAAGEPVSASSGHGALGSTEAGPEVNWSANVQRGTKRFSGPAARAAGIGR